jgi:hypothetical protein
MAFSLGFTTTDYNDGKSLLILDASTEWSAAPIGVTAMVFTITSLYTGTVLPVTPYIKTVLVSSVPFQQNWQVEITAYELGFTSADATVPDSIYSITMTLVGNTATYTSEEVVYYNTKNFRDMYVAEHASFLCKVYGPEIDYSNWLDFLVVNIEANSVAGNSSAIYWIFDIMKRLDRV